MSNAPPVARTSPDLVAERIEQLRALFPDAVSEGKLDGDKLRLALGEAVDSSEERFSFHWAGKRDAVAVLQTPSNAMLTPCPKESIDWEKTGNLFIEGENLEVLKLLFKPYFGRVKMIYIDPPYNTGQDFVYPDDFADPLARYLQLTKQTDAAGNLVTSNPETSGRYHSTWLSMIYPRLFLARQLLRDDGVIFVSIDDQEVHHLRMVMNEIFGEENFVGTVVWQKRVSPDNDEKHFTSTHDDVVCYARSKPEFPLKGFSRSATQDDRYENPDNDPRGAWTSSDLTRREYREHDFYKIKLPSGREVEPSAGRSWSIPKGSFQDLIADNRIWFGPDSNAMPGRKRFLTEVSDRVVPVSWWNRDLSSDNQSGKRLLKDLFPELKELFETPKPTLLVSNLMKMTIGSDDLILDFFSGSGTTAHAVLELNREDGGNRRFIMVQLPEPTGQKEFSTIAEIGKERIRRVIAFDNPQDFATKAVHFIRSQAADQLVAGIQYEKIDEWYELDQFDAEIPTSSENLLEVTRSIYDFIVFQSKTEKDFAASLEKMEAVQVFVKLPNWFKVMTPIGNYNPDWAIAIEKRDAHGDAVGETLYMVRETKSSTDSNDLRPDEDRKIKCGKRHFTGALGVDFEFRSGKGCEQTIGCSGS